MADIVTNGTAYPIPLPPDHSMTDVVENLDIHDLMLERGTTGLKRAGGFVREEYLSELVGQAGIRKFREMSDQSAIIGACLFAVQMLLRQVEWSCRPPVQTEEAIEYADLLEGMLFEDLDQPWSMLLSEILSFLPYGFSFFEIVLKRRLGLEPPDQPDGRHGLPSKFNDGLLGFGKIAQRSQDTIYRWSFDWTGEWEGLLQIDPFAGRQSYIPREKGLLFRATSYKNNPEGRSVLRNAYRSWYLASHTENIEAVGCERDLAGLP